MEMNTMWKIQKLPYGRYKWAHISLLTSGFIKNYDDDSNTRYLIDVDVEYPKELHNNHQELPFLAERKTTLEIIYEHKVNNDIKKKHRKVYNQLNIKHQPENKLLTTLYDKDRYIVNISTLKQALNHGLLLKKVHRAIEF